MPPPVILDPLSVDTSRSIASREAILEAIPQRYEFLLLDGIAHCDVPQLLVVGYHDVRTDAWWARGHIPGRPLLPGVLMIELAGQLAAYLFHVAGRTGFLGFAGVDGVKFRDAVEPPCRLVMVGRGLENRARRLVLAAQGFVGRTMVFEGIITGMPM